MRVLHVCITSYYPYLYPSDTIATRVKRSHSTFPIMIISQKQLEPFAQHNLKKFEDEMVLHITDFAPNSAKALKEKGVRKVVQLGMQNANKYGFTKKGPVRFYIEMMFMFGSYFDTDFQYPWIRKVLLNNEIKSEIVRADLLHIRLMEYLNKAIGKKSEYALRALVNSNQLSATDFKNTYNASGTAIFEKGILRKMYEIYPEKSTLLGDEILMKVISTGIERAQSYQIDTLEGKLIFISILFSLGHQFDRDPQFPWIINTLTDSKLNSDPGIQAENLKKKMEIYIMRTLKNLK